MLYTFGSVRSGRKTTNFAFRIDAAQPQTDGADQPGSERKVRPGPNGRGAERVGQVVEKNCIMWIDKLVLWEYTVSRLIGGGREMLQKFEVSELLPWQQRGSDRAVWGPQNT